MDRGATPDLPPDERGFESLKRSAIAEAVAGAAAPGLGEGWEQGRRGPARAGGPEAAAFSGPETPTALAAPELDRDTAAALALRGVLSSSLSDLPNLIAVRVSTADVWEENAGDPQSSRASRISTAQVIVGQDPRFPIWSRATLLSGAEPPWPPAWIAAAQRAIVGVTSHLPRVAVDPADFDGLVVVDAFAAADLLRLVARAWARRAPTAGRRVAAAGVHISTAALFAPTASPSEGPANAARSATRLVEAGVWVGPTSVRPEAGVVPASWRQNDPGGLAAAPLWLEVRTDRGPAAWPETALVITGLVPLRSAVLGRGHIQKAGRPTATWGPSPLPDFDRWLTRVAAAVSPPIDDATGVPVQVPAIVLEP